MAPTGRRPSTAFQTDDAGAPNSSWSWVGTFLNARAGTIYAGSSQIQRNIIGEMVLGLPKEPKAADKEAMALVDAVRVVPLRASVASILGCGPPRARSTAPRCHVGGGGAVRSCRSRPATTCASGCRPNTDRVDHRIEAVDVLNYLSWCKLNRAAGFLIPVAASGNSLAPDGRRR